jgi:hypothetical protein
MVAGRAANVAGKGGGPFGCRRGSEVPLNPGNFGGGKAETPTRGDLRPLTSDVFVKKGRNR